LRRENAGFAADRCLQAPSELDVAVAESLSRRENGSGPKLSRRAAFATAQPLAKVRP
jgi:hypothetical protein